MSVSTPLERRLWEPLLDTNSAQPALASVREIASVLNSYFEDQRRLAEHSPYLGEGAAATAIFFAYLHAAGLSLDKNLALEYLNFSVDALAGQPMQPSLFSGFTGIAWAAQHISGLFASSDDLGQDIDLALEIYLDRSPWQGDYDLINGLVGLGVYCLERNSSPVAVRCLELIVRRLGELARHSPDGLYWFTAPDLLSELEREIHPHGYCNLGLAHGVPGIIALLGRIYAAGIARENASQLLEGAVCWLLRQQLSDAEASRFAALLVPDAEPQGCRLAWCYGDAGVAAALLLAARCTGTKDWEVAALNIARRAATRDLQSCGVIDACFCHGSSGLAHIFNRIHQATRDQLFADAARFWIKKTLQFHVPNAGAAGYSVMVPNEAGEMKLEERYGLITGIAGVGLALLAAISNVEPMWDSIFMSDIPPVARP